MSRIVFHDPSCPVPYDTAALSQRAVPGTEASVTRIADALGAFVVQHNRTEACGRYLPPQRLAGIEHVVLIRDSRALPQIRRLYPHAHLHLWLHDKIRPGSKRGRRLAATVRALRETRPTFICVSNSHRADVESTLRWIGLEDPLHTRTIYNPVDEALVPDGSRVDDRRLVFFSSPNKGLAFALDAFRALRRAMPDLILRVGNPGYKAGARVPVQGVEFLGPLPQPRIHLEVRGALCTFHPNFLIPETFGMVFAESKALGTPVLTHDFGAAAEVIDDPGQVLPVNGAYRLYERIAGCMGPRWRAGPAHLAARLGLFDAYVERIRAWRAGARPVVGPDPRFRLGEVAAQWRKLLSP